MEGQPVASLVSGPFQTHAEGFIGELAGLGYSPRSFAAQLRLLRHLSGWLAVRGLATEALTEEMVRAFVAERRTVTTSMRSERALVPFLRYLRGLGVAAAAAPGVPSTPAEALLQRFGSFLSTEKGLAPETVRSYVSLVRPFVLTHAERPGGWASLAPRDVDEFIVARAAIERPGSVCVRANALRSLLRWMWREHLVAASLLDAVERVAAPSTATFGPAALDAEAVAGLFTALSGDGPGFRRDEAVLVLLVRLGLRVGEVASLRLEDLDWRAGVIRVRGKRGRVDELPLPTDVGTTISVYLRQARPSGTAHREVFLALDAPHRPLTRSAVSSVVVRARDRAGIKGPGAAHRLRHTAACSVLACGGGLAEVAQLLRHEHPAASARYARTSLDALAVLARPWPAEAAR
ncbi:MAG: site-specific integrase [Actinobacteria bacterium]|nr:site-specific integrase [Actinomycetota bacterium]